MKIAWLAHRDPLNPKAGGAERIIYEVAKRLLQYGHEVTILSGGWKNCKHQELLDGIKIIRFGTRIQPHFVIPSYLLKNNYDLVIADLGHAVPWVSPILLRKRTVVSFLHLHARSLRGQVGKVLASLIAGIEKLYFIIYRKQQFITISSTSFNDLQSLGINKENITIINPGVNNEIFKPGIKTDYPSMVYFGGMRPYKRPEESLYLFNLLKSKIAGLKITVIGEGITKPMMEKLASDLNITNNVVFTGKITYERIAELVSQSWLNIHTSRTEGWGISITEASAAGTPTVAYDVPGVRDAVEQDKNGIKVKDGDRKALAGAAYAILSDPKKWWTSSVEIAKKYSWDRTAEMWETLIQEFKRF